MNNTGLEFKKVTNVNNSYTSLPSEWKAAICVFAGLAIILVCLLYLCIVKYREKKILLADNSSIPSNRWIIYPNFPGLFDGHCNGAGKSKKTKATYHDNLLIHISCHSIEKPIYKGKSEMCQAFI